jgi:hypothetical protein
MTALGIGMGVSTLALSWWYKAPVLTAWSTPGAALLATSLHGVTLPETIGVFIFANALILLCGITGLFARLMKLIPHSLAAAMLAGVLLQFGLHAFAHLEGHFLLCGSMIAAWLIAKALAPRYAIVVTLLVGGIVAWAGGDVVTDKLTLSCDARIYRAHVHLHQPGEYWRALLPGHHGLAKRAGVRHDESLRLSAGGLAADHRYGSAGAAVFPVWRLFYLYRGHYCRHLPKPGCASGCR